VSNPTTDLPAIPRITLSPCPGNAQLQHPMERPVQHMAMYAAILGRLPEIDAAAPAPLEAAADAVRERPWSPVVLSIYLREVYRQTYKVTRPEVAAWLKKQSDSAMKRIAETQTRMAKARSDRAA